MQIQIQILCKQPQRSTTVHSWCSSRCLGGPYILSSRCTPSLCATMCMSVSSFIFCLFFSYIIKYYIILYYIILYYIILYYIILYYIILYYIILYYIILYYIILYYIILYYIILYYIILYIEKPQSIFPPFCEGNMRLEKLKKWKN